MRDDDPLEYLIVSFISLFCDVIDDETLIIFQINCEAGIVIVTNVANLLLCLYANNNVGLGILKTKIQKLKESLEPPLKEISI